MNVEDYGPQGKRWWVIPHARRPRLRVLGFDPEREIDQISLELMFDDDAAKRSTARLRRELPPLIFETRVHADGPSTMANLFTAIANETPATTELDLEGAGWAPGGVEIEIEAGHGESRQNGSVDPDSEVIGNS